MNKKYKGIIAGIIAVVVALVGFFVLKQGNGLDSLIPSDETTEYTVMDDSEQEPSEDSESKEETKEEKSDTKKTDTTENEKKETVEYRFRNKKYLDQHYEKHGREMGFASAEDYEKAASDVVNNPSALHKTEKEDGDDVFYVEDTNEFVILSQDGYIRTYFLPDAGLAYYNRQ